MTRILPAKVLPGIFCALLAGCGSLDAGRYAVAPGAPAAKLHIDYVAPPGSVVLQVMVIPRAAETKCPIQITDMALLTALGGAPSSGYTPAMSRDVLIGAGEPITLRLGHATYRLVPDAVEVTQCNFRVKFTPDAGAEYRMTYRRAPAGCSLLLAKRTGLDAWVNQPYVDPNPTCK